MKSSDIESGRMEKERHNYQFIASHLYDALSAFLSNWEK
jgi:hypothetical protein